ncbi:MAG: DUF1571 domain-containing protein, partial [Pirellulales bacterium]|nr:DUF1571 domain-containing protein [Pirellulales bacterium]
SQCANCVAATLAVVLLCGSQVQAQSPQPIPRDKLEQPVYRVPFNQQVNPKKPQHNVVQVAGEGQQHPLVPAIERAKAALKNIDDNIKDYSCTLVKRERVNGTLMEPEYMFTKVRHKPFSVYMFFVGPKSKKGQEALYVEGRNQGKLIGHAGGGPLRLALPTVHLDPEGSLAMRGNRYPITEVGIRTLTARLIEVAENDAKYGECTVNWYKNAKVAGRTCTCLQVVHPVRRTTFTFNVARVYIDDELNIPIRYEAYDWPKRAGGRPELIEEYTYTNLKLNQGFTDADFDQNNATYGFKK